MSKIKMYIVLRPDITPGMAACVCSHAGLAGFLKWKDAPIVQEWVNSVFYKVICKANSMEHFNQLKNLGEHIVLTESALNNAEVCLVFKPFVWTKSSIFTEIPLYA